MEQFTLTTKIDSIWAAAEHLLRRDAEELRESSTSSQDRDDWTGEEEAKEDYDKRIAAADALASLLTVAAALPPSYLGGSLVANVTTGECLVRMHFGNAKEAERWFDTATDSREAAPKAAPAPTTQAAPQPAVQQGEPLAWMDDGTLRAGSEATAYRVVTDVTKRGMTASLAASFITPLYAHPAAPAAQGDALGSHDVREPTAIGCAVNRAARDLPEGWEIRIDLERGAGVVHLTDPEGNETMIDGRGELFSDQINAAIDAACAAKEGAKP